jgi:hypothetical protein
MIASFATWFARSFVRSTAIMLAMLPVWITVEAFYTCIMCGQRCGSALRAEEHGREGEPVPLCSSCYDDEERLLGAMRFARAMWRR